MTLIIDKLTYRAAYLYASCSYRVIARLYLKKTYGRWKMWDPKTAGVDKVLLETENLNTILETVISNSELNTNQKNSLLGMALNASTNLSYWCEAKEKRHE